MDRAERQFERMKLAVVEEQVGTARLALRRAMELARDRPVLPSLRALAAKAAELDTQLLSEIDRLHD